jgi:hypothetical protein
MKKNVIFFKKSFFSAGTAEAWPDQFADCRHVRDERAENFPTSEILHPTPSIPVGSFGFHNLFHH